MLSNALSIGHTRQNRTCQIKRKSSGLGKLKKCIPILSDKFNWLLLTSKRKLNSNMTHESSIWNMDRGQEFKAIICSLLSLFWDFQLLQLPTVTIYSILVQSQCSWHHWNCQNILFNLGCKCLCCNASKITQVCFWNIAWKIQKWQILFFVPVVKDAHKRKIRQPESSKQKNTEHTTYWIMESKMTSSYTKHTFTYFLTSIFLLFCLSVFKHQFFSVFLAFF